MEGGRGEGSFALHWWSRSSDEEENNEEEENLRHDLLDLFHREETLQREREEIAGRLARKILGGNDDEFTQGALACPRRGTSCNSQMQAANSSTIGLFVFCNGCSKRMQAIIPCSKNFVTSTRVHFRAVQQSLRK